MVSFFGPLAPVLVVVGMKRRMNPFQFIRQTRPLTFHIILLLLLLGATADGMDLDVRTSPMAIATRENTNLTTDMGKECIGGTTAEFTLGVSRKTSAMALAPLLGQTGQSTMEISSRESAQAMGNTPLPMAESMSAHGKMDAMTDSARLLGRTGGTIAENGATAWQMAMERRRIRMAPFDMKASGGTISRFLGSRSEQVVKATSRLSTKHVQK